MTKENKIMILEARIAKLKGRGNKNVKAPGTLKKLNRQLKILKNNEIM